jgi:hypothetical protein
VQALDIAWDTAPNCPTTELTAEFVPAATGTYSVSVTYCGQPIKDSPWQLQVGQAAGAASPGAGFGQLTFCSLWEGGVDRKTDYHKTDCDLLHFREALARPALAVAGEPKVRIKALGLTPGGDAAWRWCTGRAWLRQSSSGRCGWCAVPRSCPTPPECLSEAVAALLHQVVPNSGRARHSVLEGMPSKLDVGVAHELKIIAKDELGNATAGGDAVLVSFDSHSHGARR